MTGQPPRKFTDDQFATPPPYLSTSELLFRFRRLVLAMLVVAIVMALLPIPSVAHVIVLLVVPVFVLIVAIKYNDLNRDRFFYRYARILWRHRRDRAFVIEAGERSRDPMRHGLRNAGLLLALFVAIFMIGLVLAGMSAGISEALYD